MGLRRWMAVLPVVVASAAAACPVCVTETGLAVRAGIGRDFAANLLAVAAPVPVMLLVVAAVDRWARWIDR